MKITTNNLSGIFVSTLFLAFLPNSGHAQAMSPMRGEVKSFTNSFAVRVYPANPYEHRIKIEVKVYDQDFNPVNAIVSPSSFTLGARFARPVTVMIPFEGQSERKVRICTESIPFPRQSTTQIKAQVCGKFLGRHL
jgi:hypothetical protein